MDAPYPRNHPGLGPRHEKRVVFGIAAGIIALNAITIATGQGAVQISLCLTLMTLVVATHYALGYREVVAAVRRRGLWDLFEVE